MSETGMSRADAASLGLNPSVWGGGFLVFLAFRFEPPGLERWSAAALAVVFVTILPISLLFVLKALGRLSDVEMRNRSERGAVYLACGGSYLLGTVSLYMIGAAWPVWGVVALHVLYATVLAAANRHWKVSIHAVGLAGIFAAALVLFGVRALPLLGVVVLGAWARWSAGAHSVAELVGGAAIGFVLTGGSLYMLRLLMAG